MNSEEIERKLDNLEAAILHLQEVTDTLQDEMVEVRRNLTSLQSKVDNPDMPDWMR
jgi:peptidoglycan hydrolase CwlO-like protein